MGEFTRDGMASTAAACEAHTLRPLDTVRTTLPEIIGWARENGVNLERKGDKTAMVNAARARLDLPPFEDALATPSAAERHSTAPVLPPIASSEAELIDLVLTHNGTVIGMLTPQLAAVLMDLNVGNRPKSAHAVERFRKILRDGLWVNTGEAVIVSREGLLNDGQHRCQAVIDTGISVEIDVRFGIAREAFKATGTGQRRTAGHAFHILGKTDSLTQAAIARLIHLHDSGTLGARGNATVETPVVVQAAEANPTIAKVARFIQRTKFAPTRTAPFGFPLVLASRVAPLGTVLEFAGLVASGLADVETNAARALHVKLMSAHMSKRRLTQLEIAALTVRSWNSWINGRPVRQLKLLPGDTEPGGFPEADAPPEIGDA